MRLLSSADRSYNGLINYLILFGLLLVAFGYYISASIAVLMDVDSRPINIAYRLTIVLLLFLPAIFIPMIKQKLSFVELVFSCFWIIYLVRLIFDTQVLGISYNNDSNKGLSVSYIFLILTFNILLPFLIVFRYRMYIDAKRLFKYLSFLILLCGLLVFISVITSKQYLVDMGMINRFSLGADGSATLNPIRISITGTTTIFTAIYWLTFIKLKLGQKLLLLSFVIVGAFNLLIGASRGPVVVLLLSLIALIYFYIRKGFNVKKLSKLLFWSILTIISLSLFIAVNIDKYEIFDRIFKTVDQIESGEQEERSELYNIAWNMFLKNPILGKQFVTSSRQNHLDRVIPHNIILESLMAIGVIGSIFLFIILAIYLRRLFCVYKFSFEVAFIILLTLIFLLQSMVSGGLFLEVEFFTLLFLSLTLKSNLNSVKNKYINIIE